MSTVYVIVREQGEYSDRWWKVSAVMATRPAADVRVAQLIQNAMKDWREDPPAWQDEATALEWITAEFSIEEHEVETDG